MTPLVCPQRWWLSWWEPAPDGDYRPTVWPLPREILGYWSSGVRVSDHRDDEHSLVAWVEGATSSEAWEIVCRCWPSGALDTRFTEPRADHPADRFPPPKWAIADGRWPVGP